MFLFNFDAINNRKSVNAAKERKDIKTEMSFYPDSWSHKLGWILLTGNGKDFDALVD